MMWKSSLSAFNIFRSAALALAIVMTAAPVGALNPERGLAQYLRDEWGPSKGYTGGSVYGFAQTADGFLWIAGENGVVRFDGLTFSPLAIPQSAAFEGPTVLGAAVSDDGALWLRMRGRASSDIATALSSTRWPHIGSARAPFPPCRPRVAAAF
jgi:hypothetical protein